MQSFHRKSKRHSPGHKTRSYKHKTPANADVAFAGVLVYRNFFEAVAALLAGGV
jgi:hypothetical protein